MNRQSGALAALVLVLAALAFGASSAAGSNYAIVASANVATTTLTNDVLPDLGSYTDLGPVAAGQRMQVVVPLQHDDAAIAAYEASLNDPSSSSYEQWLTPAQFQAKFDAPAGTVSTVRNFVTRDGFQIIIPAGLGDLSLVRGQAVHA